MDDVKTENIEEQIQTSILTTEEKNNLLAILRGELLPPLSSDAIAKKIFSPDEHPERLDFILQRVMKDSTIEVEHSASNEGILQNAKVISDIPAWLKDHRLTDLEMQVAAQDYIFNRTDIYASEMLMIQYSSEKGQRKSEIDYSNVNGIIIVVLMKNSPKVFRDFDSNKYIHRITKAKADSGLEFNLLRQMVFVQLDKALDEFVKETYSLDEDLELLKLLAMIADVNNEKVKQAINGNKMCEDICREASIFSRDKEVQAMLLEEKMAIADWNSNRSAGRSEGREEQLRIDARNFFSNGASFELVSKSIPDIPHDELEDIFNSVVRK